MWGRGEALAEELLGFWATQGFTGEQARQRLPEVVCVLRRDGHLAGVSSVFEANLELVAGRRFWIYRSLLRPDLEDHAHAMIRAAFAALDAGTHDAPGAPIGLCILLDARERQRLPPEAEWPDPRTIYAGYLRDGRQVRLAYFSDQISMMAGPTSNTGYQPEPGYRIEAFSEQDIVGAPEIVELWTREGVLSPDEAQRRISEVLLIATDEQQRLAGIATTYLARNEQLRESFWHYRTFVPERHRKSNIAVSLVQQTREYLDRRYVGGHDRRAIGLIFEIENEGLKRAFPKPVWYESDVILIGENALGAHVRVHYFPGARAPDPELSASY